MRYTVSRLRQSWEGKLKAAEEHASEAMKLSGAKRVTIIKGWFSETLSSYDGGPIAILRLDGDFYASVMDSLVNLWPHVVTGGLIILDDYYTWGGCTRAVHDFLSQNELNEPIQQFHETYAFIIKQPDTNQSSGRFIDKVEASAGLQPQ